jgi:DNA-binding Xre family transcriptional regulator
MVSSPQEGGKVRSKLKELVTKKEIELGRRIKQAEIAAETGLNPNTISRWMSPEPFDRFQSEPIVKLCRWLNCTINDLIYIDYGPEQRAS